MTILIIEVFGYSTASATNSRLSNSAANNNSLALNRDSSNKVWSPSIPSLHVFLLEESFSTRRRTTCQSTGRLYI